MDTKATIQLIIKGVRSNQKVWADFGAGNGTFTFALAEILGAEGVIYAIDQNPTISARTVQISQPTLNIIRSDIMGSLSLPLLDGAIAANVLHFSAHPQTWIQQIMKYIKPNGTLIIIEYDLYRGNTWIPFPIPATTLTDILANMGFSHFREIGRRPSIYGHREIYSIEAIVPALD